MASIARFEKNETLFATICGEKLWNSGGRMRAKTVNIDKEWVAAGWWRWSGEKLIELCKSAKFGCEASHPMEIFRVFRRTMRH